MAYYSGVTDTAQLITVIKNILIGEGWVDYDTTYNVLKTPDVAPYQFFVRFVSVTNDMQLDIACYLGWDSVNHTGSEASLTKPLKFYGGVPTVSPATVTYIMYVWSGGFVLWVKGDSASGIVHYSACYIGDMNVLTEFPHAFPVVFMCSSYFYGNVYRGAYGVVSKNRQGIFVWGATTHPAHLVSLPQCTSYSGYSIGDINTPEGERLYLVDLYLVDGEPSQTSQGVYGKLKYVKGVAQEVPLLDGDEVVDNFGNSYVVVSLFDEGGEFLHLIGYTNAAKNIKKVAVPKV